MNLFEYFMSTCYYFISVFLAIFMLVSNTFSFFLVQCTSASVVSGDFHGSDVQSQTQQESDQLGKQGASLVQKLQGSSRLASTKLKPESAKRTGSRANQGLPTSRTGEPSRTKSRSSKMQQGQSSAVHRPNDSRKTRKNPAQS
jgi:hypothetical protein